MAEGSGRHYVYGLPYAIDHPTYRGMPCYIGAGSGDRKNVHLRIAKSGKYRKMKQFYDYISSCLARGLNPVAFVICSGLTQDQAYALERELIERYGRIDLATGCLLNCSAGGAGATQPNRERLAARAARQIGKASGSSGKARPRSAVEASAAWHRGRKRTAEIRSVMSARKKGVPKSDSHKAALSAALTGHVRSEESKAKQSAAIKGRPKSPETRERMRAASLLREARKREARGL